MFRIFNAPGRLASHGARSIKPLPSFSSATHKMGPVFKPSQSIISARSFSHYNSTSYTIVFLGIVGGVLINASYSDELCPLFKKQVDDFCEDQNYHFSFPLLKQDYQQLSWLMHNKINSPELRKTISSSKLNMEIQRALSRLYCFDLLIREYQDNDDLLQGYSQFVKSQENSPLSFKNFCWLREQMRALDYDQQEVIKITCILTKSQYGDSVLKENKIDNFPADTEEFLIWLCENNEAMDYFPISHKMTRSQKKMINEVYIPLHGRANPFTEGPYLMALHAPRWNVLWQARWWTNIMGFRGHEGPGAKYLTNPRFEFFRDYYDLLKQNKNNPTALLKKWLDQIIKKSNLHQLDLDVPEQILVAHILAFYGEYLSIEKVHEVIAGIKKYEEHYPKEYIRLIKNYNTFITLSLKTPTYTPAILASALSESGTAPGVEFTLAILSELYKQTAFMANHTLSCRNIAWSSNLKKTMGEWQKSGQHPKCKVQHKDSELSCTVSPILGK